VVVPSQGRQGKRWRCEKARFGGAVYGRKAKADRAASGKQPGRKTGPAACTEKADLRAKRQDPWPGANARRKGGADPGDEGRGRRVQRDPCPVCLTVAGRRRGNMPRGLTQNSGEVIRPTGLL